MLPETDANCHQQWTAWPVWPGHVIRLSCWRRAGQTTPTSSYSSGRMYSIMCLRLVTQYVILDHLTKYVLDGLTQTILTIRQSWNLQTRKFLVVKILLMLLFTCYQVLWPRSIEKIPIRCKIRNIASTDWLIFSATCKQPNCSTCWAYAQILGRRICISSVMWVNSLLLLLW